MPTRAKPRTTSAGAKAAAARREKISYQGEPGANSHIACAEVFPDLEPMPCATFEDALAAVKSGDAHYAMIPIENSVAGRVADIHHLLPGAGLYIVGEHFLPIRFQLMGLKGAKLGDIKDVYSHVHALGQCRKIIRKLGIKPHVAGDTAGAARQVAEWGDKTRAAFAPRLAAEVYGLDILASDVEDEKHNTTRFVILSRNQEDAAPGVGPYITTFIFRVRNVPAALESYQLDGAFTATMFYSDIEGHPADRSVQLAMEELAFFSTEVAVLGTYHASPYRAEVQKRVNSNGR
jgi:prephenate dehydratase